MATNDPRKPDDRTPTDPKRRAKKPGEPGADDRVDLGDLPPGGDSGIPLASLPEPPSGQSLTTWTEVIRRQRAAQDAARAEQPYEVDSASDKDLLNRLVEAERRGEAPSGVGGAKRPGDTSEIPEASLPIFPAPPKSESEIDLGPSPSSGPATGGSEVRFDILYPPSDAGGAMPLPSGGLAPLSSVDFFPAMAVPAKPAADDEDAVPFAAAVDPNLSGVDLGGSSGPISHEPGRSSILDVLLREPDPRPSQYGPGGPESDILDFGDTSPGRPARPTHAASGADPSRSKAPTQPGFDMGEAVGGDGPIDLTGPASGLHSEEAIDLLAGPAAPPSLTDSGTLEISPEAREESERRSQELESSAVDLNPRPSFSGSEFDVALEPERPVRSRGSDADIDLNLPPLEDASGSSVIQPRVLAADQKALAEEFEARRRKPVADKPAERARPSPARRELIPVRGERAGDRSSRGYLLHGGIIGLLLGAGAVLAAYFGGALPNRKSGTTEQSAEVTQLKQDLSNAKREAADNKLTADTSLAGVRKALTDANVPNANNPAQAITKLAQDKRASDDRVVALTAAAAKGPTAEFATLQKAASDAQAAERVAKKNLAIAELTATAAKNELTEAKRTLTDASKAAEQARKEAGDVKKAAEDKLAVAQAAFDAKEKEATAKLAEAAKRETELTKTAEAAKKAGDDAMRARDASESLIKSIGERLAKAKLVGDKPDAAAVARGVEDAIKAATTDATVSLRDDLVKAREQESKLKTDLAAAREKEAEASKSATALKAEAQKLTAEAARLKTDNDKLGRDAADATAKAVTAQRVASQDKAEAERLAADLSRLKTENDRLARDIETVRELAEMIRTPGTVVSGPLPKQEPGKLAARFFDDGMRAFNAARYPDAESNFRKAIQFRPDDARYHYLLGLVLWMTNDSRGADAEFEKGRDLELAGQPASRLVSTVLERVQGPARQAVNAYRP